MRGISFVVAALAAVKVSADQNEQDNAFVYMPSYGGVGQPYMGMQEPMFAAPQFMPQPAYVPQMPQAPQPYGYGYPQAQPYFAQPGPVAGPRYIEMPTPTPHFTAPEEAKPAAPKKAATEDKKEKSKKEKDSHVKYVEVPEPLFEKFMAEATHHTVVDPVIAPSVHHTATTVVHDPVVHHTMTHPATPYHPVPVVHHTTAVPVTTEHHVHEATLKTSEKKDHKAKDLVAPRLHPTLTHTIEHKDTTIHETHEIPIAHTVSFEQKAEKKDTHTTPAAHSHHDKIAHEVAQAHHVAAKVASPQPHHVPVKHVHAQKPTHQAAPTHITEHKVAADPHKKAPVAHPKPAEPAHFESLSQIPKETPLALAHRKQGDHSKLVPSHHTVHGAAHQEQPSPAHHELALAQESNPHVVHHQTVVHAAPVHPVHAVPVHPVHAVPVHHEAIMHAAPVHPMHAVPVHHETVVHAPVHPVHAVPVHHEALVHAAPIHPVHAVPVHHETIVHAPVHPVHAVPVHHEAIVHHDVPVHHETVVHHAVPVHPEVALAPHATVAHAVPVHHQEPHSQKPHEVVAVHGHDLEHPEYQMAIPVIKDKAMKTYHEDAHPTMDKHATVTPIITHGKDHLEEPKKFDEHVHLQKTTVETKMHSYHDMDPSHHHMTSEYTHGHEYDTYHYEDKKHRPLHFTVTRPEQQDVVSKGSYYHAYPDEVAPSYSHHHDDTRAYETEDYPFVHKGYNVHYPELGYGYSDMHTPKHQAYSEPHQHAFRREYAGDDWFNGSEEEDNVLHHPYDQPYGYGAEFGHYPHMMYAQANDVKVDPSNAKKDDKTILDHKYDVAHHTVEHIVDDYDSHNIEDLDELHHSQLSGDDKPTGTTHEWHHDSHYDQEHFYDEPLHHGGLHGRYDDPMVTGSHFSAYDDEEHVAQFRHHSEEPLTHTEEYYYGAPIHHFHHDYHHTNVSHSCWKKSYGRTVGKPLSTCPDDKEKDGALCYPYCQDGFSGVGPVCWQNCPKESGFRDDGAYCYKPDAYGRGAGQVHSCYGCEHYGEMFYPKCKEGFHNVGCCVCSPDCPKNMTDIGISCAKDSYSRTAGIPLQCKEDEIQSGALCYPKCEHGATGVGPVCWGQCPPSTRECGALCLGKDEICSEWIANEVKIAFQLVVDAAEHVTSGTVIDMAHIGSEVTFPNCPAW